MEYKYDDMSDETIERIKQHLGSLNWDDVTVKSLTDTIDKS